MMDAGADIVVQLNSETKTDGTLGIGWQITKKNDIPAMSQEIKAFEFDQFGLYHVRESLPYRVPRKSKVSRKNPWSRQLLIILLTRLWGRYATELEKAVGFSRAKISEMLNNSPKFRRTRTVKTSVYYGVKSSVGS